MLESTESSIGVRSSARSEVDKGQGINDVLVMKHVLPQAGPLDLLLEPEPVPATRTRALPGSGLITTQKARGSQPGDGTCERSRCSVILRTSSVLHAATCIQKPHVLQVVRHFGTIRTVSAAHQAASVAAPASRIKLTCMEHLCLR